MKKSKAAFFHLFHLYKKKRKQLSSATATKIKQTLLDLQAALQTNQREHANQLSEEARILAKVHFPKRWWQKGCSLFFSLLFALLAALLIRSLWFELFEIPTGSMRPTFQEKDRLVVSKTAFGINIPLTTGHLYFDPKLVKRGGVVIFTGEKMDIANVDTRYFYLFPGKKQYVKRLIGKPGDILYFYGGKIYGIDRNRKDISPLLQPTKLDYIDHIPYILLDGKMNYPKRTAKYPSVIVKQMNQPVAELQSMGFYQTKGKLLPPYADKMEDYYQLWGFENYGVSRLLTKNQAVALTDALPSQLEESPLYLEIFHHPSILSPLAEKKGRNLLSLRLRTNTSLLPLTDAQLQTLFSNLYTARFVVKAEKMYRYGSPAIPSQNAPSLSGVPDGTYEFYYGKGYEILFGGIRKELSPDHPLLSYSPKRLQLLYNLGIECNLQFAPKTKNQFLLPSRYVYYRNKDLYTMGTILCKKNAPNLVAFLTREQQKEQYPPSRFPYHPFIDQGPPLQESGALDIAKIERFGIQVPENQYLVLGDNYAMSQDSRWFGFVPEANLRGVPLYLFWPPISRLGPIPQAAYSLFPLPRLLIWALGALACAIWWICHRRRFQFPSSID